MRNDTNVNIFFEEDTNANIKGIIGKAYNKLYFNMFLFFVLSGNLHYKFFNSSCNDNFLMRN